MPKSAEFIPLDHENVEIIDTYSITDQSDQPKTNSENKIDALNKAMADDDGAFVLINQIEDGREIFVERFPADKFDYGQIQMHIKKVYGGGDYRVRVYVKGKIAQNKMMSIAKVLSSNADVVKAEGMTGVMQTLIERMDRQDQIMREMMHSKSNDDDAEEKMLRKMKMYADLMPQNQPQANPFEMMTQAFGLMQKMGVVGAEPRVIEAEPEPGFGDLLEKITPLMEVAMTSQMNKQQQPRQQRKQNPDPRKAQYMQWKQGISVLINAAKVNADHGMYAEMIIQQIGETSIKQFVGAGAAGIGKLQEMFPETLQYADWFKTLFEHLKAQIGMHSSVDSEYEDLTAEAETVNDSQNIDDSVIDGDSTTS